MLSISLTMCNNMYYFFEFEVYSIFFIKYYFLIIWMDANKTSNTLRSIKNYEKKKYISDNLLRQV